MLLTGEDVPRIDGEVRSLGAVMEAASPRYEIGPTDPEDMALLHFTSGTTGTPKGAVHVHGAVIAHHVTGLYALDFRPGDVFWCTADPGWVTGTSYGIIAPLTHGITTVVDEKRVRCASLVPDTAGPTSHGLVHGSDRDPDARCVPATSSPPSTT